MFTIFGAFMKYLVSFIFCVAVAGLGVFCGKTLHDKKAEKNIEK